MCHCKELHDNIVINDTPVTNDILHQNNIKSIRYIDTSESILADSPICKQTTEQYTNWANVPNLSFDSIWTVHCPIYGETTSVKDELQNSIWKNILIDGYRILKPNGTMFIYGFSEILALILSKVPYDINRRWIIWHYTNKNVASLNFWQRSHESILVLWKNDKVFHRDDVREAYTEGFLNGVAGKKRAATKGRFSKGEMTTTYIAHPNGALPRDVIKIPALAGGAGMKERVAHPTQKPLALCEKLIMSCKQPSSEGFVLIPFAGSGSECVAAKKMDLPFIGIEINEEYVKLANERLNPPDVVPVTTTVE